MDDLIYIDPEDGLRGGLPEPRPGVLYLSSDEVVVLARKVGQSDVESIDSYRVTIPRELLPDGIRLSE